MYLSCILSLLLLLNNKSFNIYFWCVGVKYFGVVKYFFRLDYTSAVQSVPLCAVQWIQFNVVKDTINCVLGRIPMQCWNEITQHPLAEIRNKPFISFNDLQPSRFALSFLPNPNPCSSWMEVAFLALDSEKLGEHVEDAYYLDFGDNMFPQYKENRKTKSVFEEEDGSDEDLEEEEESRLRRGTLTNLKDFIPQSILDFIIE